MSTVTYTEAGRILLDGSEIATFDADGGEWEAPVDAILAQHGVQRTGAWDGDDAPATKI